MSNQENGAVAAALFIFALIAAACTGWVLNFVALIHLVHAAAPVTVMFIARLVGVIIPLLGAVLGYV